MSILEIFLSMLSTLLLLGVPLAVIVGLIISIVKYTRCSVDEAEKRRKYKKAIIVFGIILGVMVLAVIALTIFLSFAIAYM